MRCKILVVCIVNVVCLTSSIAAVRAENSTTARGAGGTLIAIMSTRDGLVIMADRLARDSRTMKVFDVEKISQLDNCSAVVSSGLTLNIPIGQTKPAYSVNQTVQHMSNNGELSLVDPIIGSLPTIRTALEIGCEAHVPLSEMHSYAVRHQGFLFQASILHWNKDTKEFEAPNIKFVFDANTNKPKGELIPSPPGLLKSACLNAFGRNETFLAILNGGSADLPPDVAKAIRIYADGPFPPLASVSKEQAIRMLADLFCATCSKFDDVGVFVDVAIISPEAGYKLTNLRVDARCLSHPLSPELAKLINEKQAENLRQYKLLEGS